MTFQRPEDRIVIRSEDLLADPWPSPPPFASPVPAVPAPTRPLPAVAPWNGPHPDAPSDPGYWQPAAGTNGMAIASLICGLLGISLLALIFGYVARSQLRTPGNRQDGRGLATAGLVLGWIGVAIGVITIIALIALAAAVSNAPTYGN